MTAHYLKHPCSWMENCTKFGRNKHRIERIIDRNGCRPMLLLFSLFHSSRRHVYVMHVCCIAYSHRGYTKTC